MLVQLRIKDLAIVDELDIVFSKGLNVLTGETGAGKTIIINAVNMLLGDRSSDGMVRTGAEVGTAEALFDLSEQPEIEEKLRSLGLSDPREVLIKRTITPTGRGRVFVNGDLATLNFIGKIGETLLSVYGQHEHQTLQKADRHIEVLDEYGGLQATRGQYDESFRHTESLRRELTDLKETENRYLKERELMVFQSREIEAAQLRDGEEEALREEKRILLNAEKLVEWADGAERILYSGESSVSEQLDAALQNMREIAKIDPSMEAVAKSLESTSYQVEEATYALREYRGKIEYDPEGLEGVENRLDAIRQLKQKYGQTIGDILQFKERVDRELETLDSNRRQIQKLEERLTEAEQRTVEWARLLSEERRKVAETFQKAMEAELSALGMGKTVFEVRFDVDRLAVREKGVDVQGLRLGPKGIDTVEFYISPNVGEDPRPLSRIASGGELSRVMLAIKRIIAAAEPGQTLVFDEVDAGIGGAVAEVVGKKLKDLSRYHQVLCVTHLPQIACFADTHHHVTKTASENRTTTRVRELKAQERVEEIARMLAGIEITEKTRAHASEMIDKARKTT